MDGDDPPRPASHPPGYDEEAPYEGVDLSAYPRWWRRNVEVFERHGMRPYRPPRFADGSVTTEVIDRLEDSLDVEVRIRAVDPQAGGSWEVVVDGEPVDSVERVRTETGNSRYEVTADEFERTVAGAVEA